MAAATSTAVCDYVYMDEAKVDRELMCSICMQPLQSPSSLPCDHTFCQHCIEEWLKSKSSCPVCREPKINHNDRNQAPLFAQVRSHIILNQLNRILVRCNHCEQINIERGNFRDHQSNRPKMLVSCVSADILCSWMGPRDEQANHMAICPFQQLRSILTSFQTELKKSKETQKKLYHKLKKSEKIQEELDRKLEVSNRIQVEFDRKLRKQSSQVAFLRAFVNKRNSMSMKCKTPSKDCKYSLASEGKSKERSFSCVLCQRLVGYEKVLLHTCSSDNRYDCICRKCHGRYSLREGDEDKDKDNEDKHEDSEEEDEDNGDKDEDSEDSED